MACLGSVQVASPQRGLAQQVLSATMAKLTGRVQEVQLRVRTIALLDLE